MVGPSSSVAVAVKNALKTSEMALTLVQDKTSGANATADTKTSAAIPLVQSWTWVRAGLG
jgi:hypothetical protein